MKRNITIAFIILVFIISIILSIIYYNGKYVVTFETGTDEEILSQYIKKGGKVEEPKPIEKDGYVFLYWQLDNKKYDFNKEVTSNMTLTAKWAKNEYITITYIDESKSTTKKILKNSSINDLPILEKENYEFLGWYMDDVKYIDQVLNSDTTLIAKFKFNGFNVGDRVKIIGNYSISAYDTAKYSAGIGWDRYILYIVEGAKYKYAVGISGEVLGYFDETSISLIEKED